MDGKLENFVLDVLNVRLPFIEIFDLLIIHIDAVHLEATACKFHGQRQPGVAHTDDTDLGLLAQYLLL